MINGFNYGIVREGRIAVVIMEALVTRIPYTLRTHYSPAYSTYEYTRCSYSILIVTDHRGTRLTLLRSTITSISFQRVSKKRKKKEKEEEEKEKHGDRCKRCYSLNNFYFYSFVESSSAKRSFTKNRRERIGNTFQRPPCIQVRVYRLSWTQATGE